MFLSRNDAAGAKQDADIAVLLSADARALALRGKVNEKLGAKEAAIADYRGALTKDATFAAAADGLKRLGATP